MSEPNKIKTGFTIIELLVVITIIGILSAIGVLSYASIQKDVRDNERSVKIKIIANALEKYYEQNSEYPSCNAMSQSADTISSTLLSGIDKDVLSTPSATKGTNSILSLCADIADNSDSFAYVGNNSTRCSTGAGCMEFSIKYRSEKTNSIVTIASKHKVSVWKQIAASYYSHTCGIASNNLAYCWGSNGSGELGNNSIINSNIPVPVNTSGVLSGKTIKSISLNSGTTCVIASDNLAYCWGSNYHGKLGNNNANVNSSIPVAVDTSGVLSGKTMLSIAVASTHVCAIASDNLPYCWGSKGSTVGDDYLGRDIVSASDSAVPVAVNMTGVLLGKTVKQIATGDYSTCVIASDDMAYCWGSGTSGILGNGIALSTDAPIKVITTGDMAGKTFKSISLGNTSACAIASNDMAYCWGSNGNGQSGVNNTVSPQYSPVAVYTGGVLSGKTISEISVKGSWVCALASDKQAYCWGYNSQGQLGNNSTDRSIFPVAVDKSGYLNDKKIKSVSGSCAIASDSSAYCWGLNNYGQIGDGTNDNNLVPTTVSSIDI